MQNIDLIELIKDDTIEAMKKYKVLASSILAIAIHCHSKEAEVTEESILNNNNLFDNDLSFDSISDCIDHFIENILGISDNNTQFKDYNSVFEIYDTSLVKELLNIVEELKLNVYDEEAISEMFNNDTVVEVEKTDPNLDIYVVRKTYASEASQKISTTNKEEAIKVADQNIGYSVYNSRGEEIYTKKPIETAKQVTSSVKKINSDVFAGKLVTFEKNVHVYSKPLDRKPTRVIKGEVALYDGIERYGYFSICKPAFVGKGESFIIGYVKKNVL